VVDFVGLGGTYTAINYPTWNDTQIVVSFGETFQDQIDPATGQRNYVQDDGSGACPNEPTLSNCDGMPADTYAVLVRAIYFRDEDSTGTLTCGDTIIETGASDPFYFDLVDTPYIEKRRPNQVEQRGDFLNIYGNNFGQRQIGTDAVRIGKKMHYNTDPLFMGKAQRVISWSNTFIKVKVKVPPKWADTSKHVWVVKGGLVSNKKKLTILPASP
jgi:hypothetical protein